MELRLYTSGSFYLFNRPMREGTKPHPIRFTMYILMEGLKMLRTVAAQIGAATVGDTRVEESPALLSASRLRANLNAGLGADPEGYARSMCLYRGMKDMKIDIDEFKRVGGVELAPMSTTGCVMSIGVHYACHVRRCSLCIWSACMAPSVAQK